MELDLFAGTTAQPRDYQVRICSKVVSMLDGSWVGKDGSRPGPARSVLIDAPTGSGKTVMTLAIAQYGSGLGKRIGWAAMRRNLLRQAQEMRDSFGFRIPEMRMISMFDKDPPRDVDWLVVDEAQHDATDSMARIHGVIRPERVIGLSATPFRSDRAKLAFERTVRDVGINSLIQEGWLSRYDHYTIPEHSPRAVAELLAEDPGRWGKSVVFFRTMEECVRAREMIAAAGIRSEVVWGGSDREAQIDAFRSGGLDVLVSMSILAEGFDMEDLRTVFVRPSSRLPTVQMCGRVLRLCPGMEAKQIVQCKDTRHPFVRTARPRASFVQVGGEFLSLTASSDVEETARRYAKAVVMAEVSMPDFLLKRKDPRRPRRRAGAGRGRRGGRRRRTGR